MGTASTRHYDSARARTLLDHKQDWEHEVKSSEIVRSDPPAIGRTSRFATRVTRTLTLAFALAIVVGACSTGAQAGGGNSGDPTLSVAAPADGAEVSIPFDVAVESSVSIGPPESGNHHLHLYFDGGTDSADYDIAYSNPVQVSRQLAPGEHTIIVSLRNPDHSDAGPSQTITVVVTGSGGSGGGSPAPAATPAGFFNY